MRGAVAKKPAGRTGEKRPALMAALGVIAWLQFPRAINRLDIAAGSIEQRVKAWLYEHTLGEYGDITHVVSDSDGTKLLVAMRSDGKSRFLQQADIARDLGVSKGDISRAIKSLEAQGRVRLLGPARKRICLVPEPAGGEEKENKSLCDTNFITDPLFLSSYGTAVRVWAQQELARFKERHNLERAEFMRRWRREQVEFEEALKAEIEAKLDSLRIELGIPQPDSHEQAGDSAPDDVVPVTSVPEVHPTPEIFPEAPAPEASQPPSPETLDGFDQALTSVFEGRHKPLPTGRQAARAFATLPPGSRRAYLEDLTLPGSRGRARIDRMEHPGALRGDIEEFIKRRWPRLKSAAEAAERARAEYEARQSAEEARLAASIAQRQPGEREDWEEEFLRQYHAQHIHGQPKAKTAGGAT